MSATYGMHVEFAAAPGRGEQLAALLLEAAAGVAAEQSCRLYAVSRDAERADTVYVTELWDSREAHDASLRDPAARELIGRARPLLAAPPNATVLRPVGGKGL